MSRPLWAFTALVFGFLLLPIAIVVPVSFSESRFLEFPPNELSLKWYSELYTDKVWIDSLWRSLIAGGVAAAIATVLGTAAALSLVRGRYRGKGIVRVFMLLPLLVPLVVLAVGLYRIYSSFGVVGSAPILGVAHAALALPFVVLVMSAAVQNLDEGLESAARTLGANQLQAFWKVTMPSLRGALAVSALLAFVSSFDEVVVALFLSTGDQTLPVTIFSYLRTEITPVVAAVSAVLVLAVLAACSVGLLARARRGAAEQTS